MSKTAVTHLFAKTAKAKSMKIDTKQIPMTTNFSVELGPAELKEAIRQYVAANWGDNTPIPEDAEICVRDGMMFGGRYEKYPRAQIDWKVPGHVESKDQASD